LRGFGELEAAVMQLMWDRGAPATVRDIVNELRQQREIAYTTVLTVMDNLYKKGWLRREPAGRAHLYTVVATREEYGALVMRQALDGSGDRALALQHFVGKMTVEEAAALRQALTRYQRRIRGR
jgi:predicted transcriptional regulator